MWLHGPTAVLCCNHMVSQIQKVMCLLHILLCGICHLISLKVLCHAIRADCLLMDPHMPTWQMKIGRGGLVISLHLVFKSAHKGFLCSEFNVSNIVSIALILPINILTLWLSIVEDHEHLNSIIKKNAHVQPPHTPVHYTTILGVPMHTSCTHFN